MSTAKRTKKNLDEFLTTLELAKRWDMSTGTLENWRGEGRGPSYVKLGKGRGSPVLYRVSDVLEFERKSTVHIKVAR